MANNYYLGQSPEEFFNQTQRYFYGITRTTDGFLKVTKVNLDSNVDSINLQNLSLVSTDSTRFDSFEESVDFFDGVDPVTKMPNYTGMNFEQYKWDSNDLYYYVDGNGMLCVRVDVPYNYVEGVTTQVLPETLLTASTAPANIGNHVLAGGYNLGTIIGTGNPLESSTVTDLSFISDHEGTYYAIDMGTIV